MNNESGVYIMGQPKTESEEKLQAISTETEAEMPQNVTACQPIETSKVDSPKSLQQEEEEEKIAELEKELCHRKAKLAQRKELEQQMNNEPIICQGEWKAEYEAVVGLKHRKPLPPSPGQDAAFATIIPRPMIITADGAGSSIVSDIGAQRVVTGVRRLIDTLYISQFSALDHPEPITVEESNRWALILVKHAKGLLDDLAKEYRRPVQDFRCTLLTAIVGEHHTFWFKVGDGALVVERLVKNEEAQEYKLASIGSVGKGEYANETVFISEHLQQTDVASGSFASRDVSAMFAMSDGGALRFVSHNGDRVSGKLSNLAQQLRTKQLQRIHLTKLFYSEAFLEGHDGDDCSLALIAR